MRIVTLIALILMQDAQIHNHKQSVPATVLQRMGGVLNLVQQDSVADQTELEWSFIQ